MSRVTMSLPRLDVCRSFFSGVLFVRNLGRIDVRETNCKTRVIVRPEREGVPVLDAAYTPIKGKGSTGCVRFTRHRDRWAEDVSRNE
jgi:hypothetical protein